MMILESVLPIDSRTSKNTWANVMGILPEKYELDTRVAQMDKKCQTYWDQCFSHLFYLVILENGQKSAGKGHFTLPLGPPFIWPVYKGNEA